MKKVLIFLSQIMVVCAFADSEKIFGTSLGIGKEYRSSNSEGYSGTIEYYPWEVIETNLGFIGLGNLYFGNIESKDYSSAMEMNGMFGASAIRKIISLENKIYIKCAILGITNSNPRESLNQSKKWVSYWDAGWEFGFGVSYKKINVYICRSPYDYMRLELGYFWI